jgi:hemolysin D
MLLGLLAFVAEVDVSTTAAAQVVPQGQVKTIQPLEPGIVRRIHVHEGTHVEEGQIVVELDATMVQAERDKLADELIRAQVAERRLEAALDMRMRTFDPPLDAPAEVVATNRRLLENQLIELDARLQELQSQVEEGKARVEELKTQIQKQEEILPLAQEQLQIDETLYQKDFVSRRIVLERRERFLTFEGDIRVDKKKLVEALAKVQTLVQQKKRLSAEFLRAQSQELTSTRASIAGLTQQLKRASEQYERHFLRAPVTGIVQDLQIFSPGGVVSEADQLMTIVPDHSALVVEALVQNKDIGFVRIGNKAEVKITAFDYRRYGSLTGKVVAISSYTVNTAAIKWVNGGQKPATGTPATQEQNMFKALVLLDRASMSINGVDVKMTPGMAAEVSIVLDRRRVIDFVLEPLVGLRAEAFREP